MVVLGLGIGANRAMGDEPVLRLRAAVVGAPTEAPLAIELLRWSTDAERAPLITAFSAPPPAPPTPPEAAAAGRGGRAGRAGRGGRGGRGAAPPASPAARLSAAVKAAPTVGFIWGDGPTGYSIRYAWRSASQDGTERLVLVTDRRLGAHAPSWPQASGAATSANADVEAEFTVIEIRIDGKGAGDGKSSLSAGVVVDAEAKTLALEGYAAAPALLKVTR
jgi:hypothetical protein